jgi:hypothetical protein
VKIYDAKGVTNISADNLSLLYLKVYQFCRLILSAYLALGLGRQNLQTLLDWPLPNLMGD